MDRQLIDDAWNIYDRARYADYLVPNSVPILYFGDLNKYLNSSLRIVTVGLNPSKIEFPAHDPYKRFRAAEHVFPSILQGSLHFEYLTALNNYFDSEPYRQWFNAYEPLLNGMDASYYQDSTNTVIHTDVCSPLATDPTWKGLTVSEKFGLIEDGRALWLRLMEHLEPDVIVISVARQHVEAISTEIARKAVVSDWSTIHTLGVSATRSRQYRVEARTITFPSTKQCLLVFGQAAQMPFGIVSAVDKRSIGLQIAKIVKS